MSGSEASSPAWLQRPGEQDITAHVDFTSIRQTAEEEGLTTLGFMDQTYFLLGILTSEKGIRPLFDAGGLKTLIMPGGLGSTHKVLILGKGVGMPRLAGCSYRLRVT
jgi:SAM-dependent MidA family methyltransferase